MTGRIQPGDKVVRMGSDIASLGVFIGSVYEVEGMNDRTIDGLYLKGVGQRLNPENFEVVERTRA